MMFNIALTLHAVAGFFGLVIGPIAMYSKKSKGLHTKSGVVYVIFMTAVCVSGAILSILEWQRNWWLLFVAIFSYWFCWRGYNAAKFKNRGWLKYHISGMLGSYVAMLTAFIVVNVGRVTFLNKIPIMFFWIIPTIIAVPLIRRTVSKFEKSKL